VPFLLLNWRGIITHGVLRFFQAGDQMCGRYTLRANSHDLTEVFAALNEIEWTPRYNIAPTQTVVAVRQDEQGKGRELALMKWGLIPSWTKDRKIASSLINARADTVATKPSFAPRSKSGGA
jgi:putative SOS response-associated peptidase YedK